eukprot:1573976-Pyramimonas_sp.AAC.1
MRITAIHSNARALATDDRASEVIAESDNGQWDFLRISETWRTITLATELWTTMEGHAIA